MLEPIIYTAIEQKNVLEREMIGYLSHEESLIHCLNVLDFNLAMKNPLHHKKIDAEEEMKWIILPLKNDQ
jgi:hypothetical protein